MNEKNSETELRWLSVIPVIGFLVGGLAGNLIIGLTVIPEGTSAAEAIGLIVGGVLGAGFLPGVLGYCIGHRIKRGLSGGKNPATDKTTSRRKNSPLVLMVFVILIGLIGYSAMQSNAQKQKAELNRQQDAFGKAIYDAMVDSANSTQSRR